MSTGKWSSCLPAATSSTGGDDRLGKLLVELAEFQVGLCAGGLEVAKRMDHGERHGLVRDGKVVDGAGRRCAVQRIGRHLHLAHRVAFDAEFTHQVRHTSVQLRYAASQLGVKRYAS